MKRPHGASPFFCLRAARRHKVVTALLLLLIAVLLFDAVHRGSLMITIAYLACVSISFVIIDLALELLPDRFESIAVRNRYLELAFATIFYLIAAAWLRQHFSGSSWPFPVPNLLGILCLFQLALAAFLLLRGYSVPELGIRLRGFAPVLPIMACCMGLTALVFPLFSYWKEVYRESGSVLGIVRDGLLIAALPEEFFRMIWQSRLRAVLSNAASGWYVATLLWATMHAPFFSHNLGRSAADTVFVVARIVPYGLLLGYLTHRSQSILPAVLLHATHFLWMGDLG